MVEVNKTVYLGVEAYEITNGKVSLLICTGVGPRIISFGFEKRDSVLYTVPMDFMNKSCGYKFYGGHRLWHSPEDPVRTYQPDNEKCEVEVLELGISASNFEAANKIKKTMRVEMKENGRVRIIHSIANLSDTNYNLAAWGITQLKGGGMAVIPMDNRKTGLLPNRSITYWDYSEIADKRVIYGRDHIIVNQNPEIDKPFKIGTYNRDGYLCYFIDGDLFVKEFDVDNGTFPDFGCNSEIYVNKDFIELESLSPLTEMEPNSGVQHTEVWQLYENVSRPAIEKAAEVDVKDYVKA